ncbi:hypothetical protein D9M68_475770 [compost metagenome]
MPEQLTRHPDVTLQVLRSAGARCGEGAPQEILKACPRERFCKLPGGEVCVYGLDNAITMTQITAADWRALAQQAGPPPNPGMPPLTLAGAGTAGLLAGVLLTALVVRRRRGPG